MSPAASYSSSSSSSSSTTFEHANLRYKFRQTTSQKSSLDRCLQFQSSAATRPNPTNKTAENFRGRGQPARRSLCSVVFNTHGGAKSGRRVRERSPGQIPSIGSASARFPRQHGNPFSAAPRFFQLQSFFSQPFFYFSLLVPQDPGKNKEAAFAGSLNQLRNGLAKKDAI